MAIQRQIRRSRSSLEGPDTPKVKTLIHVAHSPNPIGCKEVKGFLFRVGRAEFVMFVHPETCLPIVLEAAPWKSLMDRFYLRLEIDLKRIECWDLFCRQTANMIFARTRDRSAIGVMVDFVKMTQAGTAYMVCPSSPEMVNLLWRC